MADRLVYSSDPDFCTVCGRSPCGCEDKKRRRQPEPVRIEFKRGGKGSGMTRIERLNLHPRLKEHMLKKFKKRFGCGGTIKEGTLEIQGDRRDIVQSELEKDGYKIRRIGG